MFFKIDYRVILMVQIIEDEMKIIIFHLKFSSTLIGFLTLTNCSNEEYSDISESEENSLVFESFILEKK